MKHLIVFILLFFVVRGNLLSAMTDVVSPDYDPWKGREYNLVATVERQISDIEREKGLVEQKMNTIQRNIQCLTNKLQRFATAFNLSSKYNKKRVSTKIRSLVFLRNRQEQEYRKQEARYNSLNEKFLELSNVLPLID